MSKNRVSQHVRTLNGIGLQANIKGRSRQQKGSIHSISRRLSDQRSGRIKTKLYQPVMGKDDGALMNVCRYSYVKSKETKCYFRDG